MNETKLGQPIDEYAKRDAVHVAVAPVKARCEVQSGQHVGKDGDPKTLPHVGIVDPFRVGTIPKGEWFYICLYPGSVLSLRHQWTHAEFDEEQPSTTLSSSEIWLRAYAMRLKAYEKNHEAAYQSLLNDLKNNHLHGWGTDLCGLSDLPDSEDLCDHAKQVLGFRPNLERFTFSCSC